LLCQDASQLPFSDNSFDVILTVHMIHTVSDWKIFLDDINRVLKPEGFYLKCQWITPPKRKEFEGYFQAILSKYEGDRQQSKYINTASQEIDVDKYLDSKGYKSSYFVAKQWTVNNTVEELLSFLKLRAYGFCWQVSDEIFHQSINEFEEFCVEYYSSLETVLSSDAQFEIWAYRLR
jgi:SAM-dependent methyltransferase